VKKKLIELEAGESEILDRFYSKVKETLQKAHNHKDEVIDFETYRWILQNTSMPPKDFMKIFHCLPGEARKNILSYLGYKTESAFEKSFAKNLNVYRQSVFRRQNHEDVCGTSESVDDFDNK